MPLYGKGMKGKVTYSYQKHLDKLTITRESRVKKPRGVRVTYYDNESHWLYHNTTLKQMQKNMGLNITEIIRKKIKPNQPPIVVEWGCSNGVALAGIARKFGEKAKYYGLSHRAYPEWMTSKSLKRIKLIHAPAEDFFRYFKDASIDVFYAHQALHWLAEQPEYIKRVLPKLKVGGVLATTIDSERLEEFIQLSKKSKPLKIGKSTYKVESNGRGLAFTRLN